LSATRTTPDLKNQVETCRVIHPFHPLADQLEADWNEKLRLMNDAREEYERGRENDRMQLDGDCREKILALARNFPATWNAPGWRE
jgi:hypothetical protein